jgi:hypothetical protein
VSGAGERKREERGDALVCVDDAVHEAVRLPPRDHLRVAPCALKHERPRPWLRAVGPLFLDFEHARGDELAECAQRLEVCVLLATAKEEDARGRVERLKGADAQEGRRETRGDAGRFGALAQNGQRREGDERERARRRNAERVHRLGARQKNRGR